jgi:hypothetical protein
MIVPGPMSPGATTPIWVDATTRLWVDGATLIVQSESAFYAVPTSGGSPVLLGQIPAVQPPALLLNGPALMDATDFYLLAYVDPSPTANEISSMWRVPRDGSAPQVVSTSAQFGVYAPQVLDADSIYMAVGESGELVALPKGGGSAVPVPGVSDPLYEPFALLGDQVFVASVGAVKRYPLDGSQPGTAIGGVDSYHGYATSMMSDEQGAYVALASAPAADADGTCVPPGCSIRLAIAALPSQSEHVTAHACTTAWTLGPTGDILTASYTPTQMALDSSHVLVLASVGLGFPAPQAILRAARTPPGM